MRSFCLLVLVVLLPGACDSPPLGGATEVRLINTGSMPLDSVAVHVTGATYVLGRLAPGDSATVLAEPTGETSVYVSRAGAADSLLLDVYFERGYGGRVRAVVTADSVVQLHHESSYLR